MISTIVQYVLYLVALVLLAIPLGGYIKKVMNGEHTALGRVFTPIERFILKVLRIKTDEETPKSYLFDILIFSSIGLVVLFLLQIFQGVLFGNPQGLPGVEPSLSFNTAVSFITNTNWQSYSGENTLSYLTGALGLTVQNFVSAAVGIAVLFALIRAFVKTKSETIGNFYVDVTRIIVHILIPLNLVIAICLVGGGVVQSFNKAETVELLEPIAVSTDGKIIDGAVIDMEKNTVTVSGVIITDAEIVTKQIVPLGLVGSQVAIKQTGTNGGGFYGTNSAHPLENANGFTNFLEMISILLIPVALCFTFGTAIKNKKQGVAIFAAMFICLVVAVTTIGINEQIATKPLENDGNVNIVWSSEQSGGNMEGKESRFGIASSGTFAAFTTAASSGSVNSMHDSYTPIGGMVTMLLMQLGEVVFGGVGSGLYGMIAFIILTVFIAGLMVGRTPEFLGKKIEPLEMKWAVVVCLATPFSILVGSGIAAIVPEVQNSITEPGIHGFSELLYTFSSCGANNGSAFAGFNANTVFLNIMLGLVMLFARFVPIIGTLAIAGSLVRKKRIAVSAGTLSTTNGLFIFLLIFVVVLIGALSFFPALALGPIAEFLN